MPDRAQFQPEADPSTLERFRVTDAREIAAYLRELRDHDALVTLHAADDPRVFLVSRLLAVDASADRLDLDFTTDPVRQRRLADAPSVTVVAFLDSVKVQFEVRGTRHDGGGEGRPMLRCPLPASMHRIQRREAYRVRPLASAPARCLVPVRRSADGPPDWLALRVLDVSVGGLSLHCPPDSPEWRAGHALFGCTLELPDTPAFGCDLMIRSAGRGSGADAGVQRLGCAFSDLSPPLERAVQIYVNLVDRQRRLGAR